MWFCNRHIEGRRKSANSIELLDVVTHFAPLTHCSLFSSKSQAHLYKSNTLKLFWLSFLRQNPVMRMFQKVLLRLIFLDIETYFSP